MDLRRLGEVGFIRALLRRHRAVMAGPPEGPGDDAALLGRSLLTTDALLEGEHFLRREPSFLLGRKALAVNLSDIAAMGGVPRAFLLALGLPPRIDPRWLDGFLAGVASASSEHGLRWAGGDTVRSRIGIVIAVSVVGERGRRLLTRAGARAGDGIWVTGPLGASAAGRALLGRGWTVASPRPTRLWRSLAAGDAGDRLRPHVHPPRRLARGTPRREALHDAAILIARHLDPVPRVAAGRHLASRGLASAAIDLSDGLSLDLRRLCESSGVGAVVLADAIPILHVARAHAARAGIDPLRLALDGGEDYELLFAAPRRVEKELQRWPPGAGAAPILVGRIRPRVEGIRIQDSAGRKRPLPAGGYDPFRSRG